MHELSELDRLYRKGGFQMVVLYGRRRVGKTTLALEFGKDKPLLAFTAKVQSDALNLADFSRELYAYFSVPVTTGSFSSWDDAFAYLASQASDQHLVFMFDEFPYAAGKNSSLVSSLQVAIDRLFTSTNIFLILTGSNQGFMEEKVLGVQGSRSGLGEKNPLFGRRTAQMKLAPFGYREAARMLGDTSVEDLVRYYACFGGTPYYLSLIDANDTFEQNAERLFFSKEGLLYEEPMMLLRQELREPAMYSSIMGAIAAGATKIQAIADRIGTDRTALGKYLETLMALGLVERATPFGESSRASRRGIYSLKEPCFDFWYRFVGPRVDVVEQNAGELAARDALRAEPLSTHVGHWFERICREWVIEQAKEDALPFSPLRFGSWWGTDPATREQDDIDVVAAEATGKTVLLGECKWRNDFNVTATVEKLHERLRLVPNAESAFYAVFSKRTIAPQVRAKFTDHKHLFVSSADLYA